MKIVINLKQVMTGSIILMFIATSLILGQESQELQVSKSESVQSVPEDINWDDRFGQLGMSGPVLAMAVSGTDLYVGGIFSLAGSVTVNNIAKWDGSSWTVLGSGTDGIVNALAVDGTDLYVGGNFTTAGGDSASNIAKWNGSNWSALGNGISGGNVRALAVSGGNVYVGGVYTTAGGDSANNIAKWDGSNWSTLGSGATNGVDGPIYGIAIKNNEVYLGGSFTTAGGNSANNIVLWNSSTNTWSQLGSGVSLGGINAVVLNQNNVYVAGLFTTAGGVSAKKVAKWDGSNWSALGGGLSGGDVNSMAAIGSELYVVGSFSIAGSDSANRIAKWDGSSWSALGSGIDGGPVFSVAIGLADVYSGGSFSTAGGKTSNKFALWNDGTVPVELTSFTAQAAGGFVNLSWTTATELNNYGFEIERMIVGTEASWEKIGFVAGNGTTAEPYAYSYTDDVQLLGRMTALTLRYRLKQIDLDGAFEYHNAVEVTIGEIPQSIVLGQNYPNPFNPETTIEFVVPESGLTTLRVYNILGQEVATLVNKNLSKEVIHKAKFDGSLLPSGTYIYIISSTKSRRSEKKIMMLVK